MKNRSIFYLCIIGMLVITVLTFFFLHSSFYKSVKYGKYSEKDFNKGLAEVTLSNSKFQDLYQLKSLIGLNRTEIENEYDYLEVYDELERKNPVYQLDSCVLIYYQNDKVAQVAAGKFIDSECFNNTDFSKARRLELLGQEDKEQRFEGVTDFGEYFYFEKGFSVIKEDKNIWSIWFFHPMAESEYNQKYSDDLKPAKREFRLNPFSTPYTEAPEGSSGLLNFEK